MKKIILFITLLTGMLFAKPCITDIYFGNGVWNSEKDAIENRNTLRKFMLYRANIRLDPNKEIVDYQFKYAHNPSYGKIDDLIETFWQLKESGQISKYYFESISNALAMKKGDLTSDEIWETIHNIVSQYNEDVVTMLHLYQESSFNQKHNVILVAHSQGNLWGNKMYSLFTDEQKKKFRMVSVATPANHVMVPDNIEPYATASEDYIISSIPGSLPGNVDGNGHEFVETYLTGSINAPRKIALYIKSAYDNLQKTTECALYDQVHFFVYGVEKLVAVGSLSDIPPQLDDEESNDHIIYTLPLKSKEASSQKECGKDAVFYGLYPLPNSGYDYAIWHINNGYIQDKAELESLKGTTLTYYSYLDSACATLVLNGALYDAVYDVLSK